MSDTSERNSPIDRRTTAKQVAAMAGVSISAVSRTFTKGASISPTTREKVLAATRTLGYQPNVLARSLMTRRTQLIGLISNNFDNPAFMEIFDLFTRLLQQRDLRPLLANLSGDQDKASALEMLLQYNVDGVIVASSTLPIDFAEACVAASLPVVHAFGRAAGKLRGGRRVSVVGADNVQGGRLAGQLLCKHEYRRIAFLGGPPAASSTRDRFTGFSAALEERGLATAAVLNAPAYSHEAGIQQMRILLGRGGIDAVFWGDDILAMGALDACREADISVPGDIGLVGFNDMAMAGWPSYNLTTIRQPIRDIITSAVGVLLGVDANPTRAVQSRVYMCESRRARHPAFLLAH